MRSSCPRMGHWVLGLLLGLMVCTPAWAALIEYTVDPAQSVLNLSGSWNGSGLWTRPAGSLSTSYTGAIQVDVTDTTIQVTSAGLDAKDSGKYAPRFEGRGGRQSGDYGGFFRGGPQGSRGNINAAFRGLGFELSSLPVSLDNGSFDAAALAVTATSGAMDYDAVGLLRDSIGRGRVNFSGTADNAASAGSLAGGAGLETLTIPVDVTFTLFIESPLAAEFNQFDLNLSGTIVASRTTSDEPGRNTPDIPEPATLALLAALSLGLVLHRRR